MGWTERQGGDGAHSKFACLNEATVCLPPSCGPFHLCRCLTCSCKHCRHVHLAVGGEQQQHAATLPQLRFEDELADFLSSDRQQRRVVGLSAGGGRIPELTPCGQLASPRHAKIIAERSISPLPTELRASSDACSCGVTDWVEQLASCNGAAYLYDVARCTQVQVFELR